MVAVTLKKIDAHLSEVRKLIESLRGEGLQVDFIDDNSPMLATVHERLKDAIAENIYPWPKTANHAGDRYEFIPLSERAGRHEVYHFNEALRHWNDLVCHGVAFQMNVISDEAFIFQPETGN